MGESSILQRLLNLENETGLVEFISYDVLQDDPGLAFPLAVMVSADLVMVDPDNQTIALTREGREVAIGLWGVGVDLEEERGKMEEERRNTDFSEVWAEL